MRRNFKWAALAGLVLALGVGARAQAVYPGAGILPQLVATNADLAVTATAAYPSGVWRVDYSAGFGAPPLLFVPESGTCAANSLVNDAGSCVDSTDGNSWVAKPVGPFDPREFGFTSLILYVATTGSDAAGNLCVISASPCLTIQNAVDKAALFTSLNGATTLNVAAGTYTAGTRISGAYGGMNKAASSTAAIFKLVGAGSGTTTVSLTSCPSATSPFRVSQGAIMQISGFTLTTSCAGGDNLFADNFGNILVGSDVVLGAASHAQVNAYNNGNITFTDDTSLAGTATYGLLASTGGSIILKSGGTTSFSSTPTYGNYFIAAIMGGKVNTNATTYSGTFTGRAFAIDTGGEVDTEGDTTPPPGTIVGYMAADTSFYKLANTCIGGDVGCAETSTPTGLGTGGTCGGGAYTGGTANVLNGGPFSGKIRLCSGSGGAGTNGIVYLGLPAQIRTISLGTGNCTATLDVSNWQSVAASPHAYYSDQTTHGKLQINWTNNAVALSANTLYDLYYNCQ